MIACLRLAIAGFLFAWLVGCGGTEGPSEAGNTTRILASMPQAFKGHGTWWNPAEPGTGFVFEAQGSTGAVAFFVYEGNGRPVWYTGVGGFDLNAAGKYTFAGTLYRYFGGQSATSTVPKAPARSVVGNVLIVFDGDTAQVKVPGRLYQVRKFNPSSILDPGGAVETGIYWNPTESGRGYTIEVANGIASIGIFHYDGSGEPVWHLVSGPVSSGTLRSDFTSYSGGQVLGGPYRAPTAVPAGVDFRASFAAPCSGEIRFPAMNAVPISRFNFSGVSNGSECRANAASTPLPGGVTTFQFGPGVSSESEQSIREGVERGSAFLASTLNFKLSGNLTVFASADLDDLVDTYMLRLGLPPDQRAATRNRWATSSTAEAWAGRLFIFTGSKGWSSSSASADVASTRKKIVAHEYFHSVQGELTKPAGLAGVPNSEVPLEGPRWLLEGAAEWIGFRALADARMIDFAIVNAEQLERASTVPVALKSLESWSGMEQTGTGGAYPLGFAGVDFLMRDVPVTSLIEFWGAIGRGVTWKIAFQSAFGRSIDVFYTEFEVHRSITFPSPAHIRGTVTGVSAQRLGGIHVYACRPTGGTCGYAMTSVDGTFAVSAPAGVYVVQFGRTDVGSAPDGFYSTSGFVIQRGDATPIPVAATDVGGIDVKLPFAQ